MPYCTTRPMLGLLLLSTLAPWAGHPLEAQQRSDERIEITRPAPWGETVVIRGPSSTRRLLGLTVRASGEASDTAGLLVERVADSSAAALAGVKPGERLVSVETATLALDRADIGDRAAASLAERRLGRALEGKKAGDQVTLVVAGENGRRRTLRATLREPAVVRTAWSNLGGTRVPRRVLGVGFAEGGHPRDTAGLLVVSVTKGGAADKAGIAPGDRIARIDDVDLRVDAADAGEPIAASQRVARLRRVLDAAKDSQPVRLEVLQDGRRRTVSVTPTTETSWTWGAMTPASFRFEDGDLDLAVPAAAMREARRALEAARVRFRSESDVPPVPPVPPGRP